MAEDWTLGQFQVGLVNPLWTPPEALPAAADWPAHQQVLTVGRPVLGVASHDGTWALVNVFPLPAGPQCVGLIEVVNEAPLTVEQQRLVSGVPKIYRHQIGLLDDSDRDTLPGLLNRKTFDEQFRTCLVEDAAHLVAASADDPPGGQAERRVSVSPNCARWTPGPRPSSALTAPSITRGALEDGEKLGEIELF